MTQLSELAKLLEQIKDKLGGDKNFESEMAKMDSLKPKNIERAMKDKEPQFGQALKVAFGDIPGVSSLVGELQKINRIFNALFPGGTAGISNLFKSFTQTLPQTLQKLAGSGVLSPAVVGATQGVSSKLLEHVGEGAGIAGFSKGIESFFKQFGSQEENMFSHIKAVAKQGWASFDNIFKMPGGTRTVEEFVGMPPGSYYNSDHESPLVGQDYTTFSKSIQSTEKVLRIIDNIVNSLIEKLRSFAPTIGKFASDFMRGFRHPIQELFGTPAKKKKKKKADEEEDGEEDEGREGVVPRALRGMAKYGKRKLPDILGKVSDMFGNLAKWGVDKEFKFPQMIGGIGRTATEWLRMKMMPSELFTNMKTVGSTMHEAVSGAGKAASSVGEGLATESITVGAGMEAVGGGTAGATGGAGAAGAGGAGGAVGAGAAGAGAAGAGGVAGATVAALILIPLLLAAFSAAILGVTKVLTESQRKLAEVSGPVAAAFAMHDIRVMMREMGSGSRRAETIDKLLTHFDNIMDKLQPILDMFFNGFGWLLDKALGVADYFANVLQYLPHLPNNPTAGDRVENAVSWAAVIGSLGLALPVAHALGKLLETLGIVNKAVDKWDKKMDEDGDKSDIRLPINELVHNLATSNYENVKDRAFEWKNDYNYRNSKPIPLPK